MSPFVDMANQHVCDYLSRFGLLRGASARLHYELTRFGTLVGCTYPTPALPEFLLITDWMAVWALFDDQLERLPDISQHEAVSVVTDQVRNWLSIDRRQVPNQDGPFGAAFVDLWRRIGEVTSLTWQSRFFTDVSAYLDACIWEAQYKETDHIPDLASYIRIRRALGGVRPALDLMELGGRYELPVPVLQDRTFLAFIQAATDVLLWTNDIFSANVEAEQGSLTNLVLILAHTLDLTRTEAALQATRNVFIRMNEMLDLEDALPGLALRYDLSEAQQADVHRFTEGVHHWIRGNADWSVGNERYRTRQQVNENQSNLLLSLIKE